MKREAEKLGINPTCGYTLAGIPNNRAGRRFLATLRKYVNPGMVERVRVRPWQPKKGAKRAKVGTWRNSNYSAWGDLKTAQARTLRVYLDEGDIQKEARRKRLALLHEATERVRALGADLANVREKNDNQAGMLRGFSEKLRAAENAAASAANEAQRMEKLRDAWQANAGEIWAKYQAIPAWVRAIFTAWERFRL